jgi:ubiquinone biosynthesis protein UbiJ
MPTDPEPLTLAEAVHRAVVVVDPDGNAGLDDLLARFEDDEEPLSSGLADVAAQRIAEESGALDPQAEDPAVQLAAAVATYLTYRRDEVDEEPHALLALAARAEFEGHPPAGVEELLAERGVRL